MVAVMGATGNTGKKIAHALLEAGEPVRALARSKSKLAELERAGATILSGDAADATFLAEAFRGADAVYTLLAADRRAHDYRASQAELGDAMAHALGQSDVRHVVFLSSLGADLSEGTGPIEGLHAQEQRLQRFASTAGRKLAANVLFLRPTFFYENFLETLGLIKHQGINADAVSPGLAVPMIATRDIAQAAAEALTARDWTGIVVRELLGPRDITFTEATRVIGARIGKPDLQYVQLPYEEMAGALVQAGVSDSFAGLYMDMLRALNEGRIKPRQGRTPENTTATRFEDFAEDLAGAYALVP